jgi:hypothetical protein
VISPAHSFRLALALAAALAARAQSLTVPNGSFELPGTSFVSPQVQSWVKTPTPAWFDPAATGGVTWDQLSGVFANTPPSSASHIANLDGTQALYLFALPTAGITQVLGDTFQSGFSYRLEVNLRGGGNLAAGTTLLLGLFYLDGANAPVTVASTTVSYDASQFPVTSQLVTFAAESPVVTDGTPWAGRNLGVQLIATSGTGAGMR